MEKREITNNSMNNKEIDIFTILRTVLKGRNTIYYSIGICLFIGLIIAFIAPAKYTTGAKLLPSVENQGTNLGNISSLASIAGVDLNSLNSNSIEIPSQLYPEIVSSYPFLHDFINEKFYFEDINKTISLVDYVCQDTIENFGKILLKYSFKLPWTIKNAIMGSKLDNEDNDDYGVLKISKEEELTLQFVKGLFMIDVDETTDLVNVSVEAKEPILAAQFVQVGIDLLQKYVINYKTKQAKENLNFIEQRYIEKKAEYEKVQESFFNYKDQHRNIITERINIEYQRLSDSYEILSSVYQSLAQQLEQAKISVKKQTPVYSIIEPVKIPDRPSGPNKIIILILSCFLGFCIGLAAIITMKIKNMFIAKLKNE